MIGQDGGLSIPLEDGRSLFVFSDTLLGPPELEGGAEVLLRSRQGVFVANCAAVASCSGCTLPEAMAALDYFEDSTGRPRELLEVTALERMAGYRIWPQHGICREGRVYLFYTVVRQSNEPGTWSFQGLGCGLAVMNLEDGQARRLHWGGDWRLWPEAPASCQIGVQVLQEDGWIYTFTSRADGLEFHAFLARVREDQIGDPAAFEFFAGGHGCADWHPDWRQSASLGECGREFSVSWNRFVGGYVMIYLEPFLRQLRMRVAPHICGPFGTPVDLGRVPSDPRTELVSLAFEHPQYAQAGGRELAISYSQPYFLQNTLVAVRLREAPFAARESTPQR